MARYEIRTGYNPASVEWSRVQRATLRAGAHFMANARWDFRDGKFTASLVVDAASDRDAYLVVPPVLRATATVTRLDGERYAEGVLGVHGALTAA